jgi:translation elongation factor EF-G
MNKYPIERIRNIGIMALIDAGKQQLPKGYCFIPEDYTELGSARWSRYNGLDGREKERGITITSAATTFIGRIIKLIL